MQIAVDTSNYANAVGKRRFFDLDDLLGLTYWYALYPLHNLVFRGMLSGISRASAKTAHSALQASLQFASSLSLVKMEEN